jgi:hypothetical protein
MVWVFDLTQSERKLIRRVSETNPIDIMFEHGLNLSFSSATR